MADNAARVAKMARILALTQIGIGVLLICFGIGDRTTKSFTGNIFFGIWIGIWMCVTGGLGIPGSGRERTEYRNCLNGVFMGFSITSAVLGGIIILFYSFQINDISQGYIDYYNYYNYHNAQMAVSAFMLILGIAEFAIGIWAAICCCIMSTCCRAQQQDQQVVDTANPGSYGIPPGGHGYQSPVNSMPIGAMGSGALPV